MTLLVTQLVPFDLFGRNWCVILRESHVQTVEVHIGLRSTERCSKAEIYDQNVDRAAIACRTLRTLKYKKIYKIFTHYYVM